MTGSLDVFSFRPTDLKILRCPKRFRTGRSLICSSRIGTVLRILAGFTTATTPSNSSSISSVRTRFRVLARCYGPILDTVTSPIRLAGGSIPFSPVTRFSLIGTRVGTLSVSSEGFSQGYFGESSSGSIPRSL